jgi:tetratricopeptide (TPR) repeat protein
LKKVISALLIILIIILTTSGILQAQISAAEFEPEKIRAFGLYLFQQKDYLRAAMELERYRYLEKTPDDSVVFIIGLCHQFRERYDFAAESFRELAEADTGIFKETARLAMLYNYSILEQWQKILDYGYNNDDEFYFYYLADVKLDSSARDDAFFQKIKDDSLRKQLIMLEHNRNQVRPKSPLLAGTLSTLIPGLGKVYIRRPGDALFSFGMIDLFALLTYKAFQADLLVTGVLSGGLTLSLYLGTIYGSYLGAELYNRHLDDDWQKQLAELNPVTRNPYWLTWQKE